MDLCERSLDVKQRHPWELARIQTIQTILRSVPLSSTHRVLDIGCGDGFTSQEILAPYTLQELVGLDIHLTEEHVQELKQTYPQTRYTNNPETLHNQRFELVLFLDVLEHIEHEQTYLQETVEQFLNPQGYVMITVPAFQFLFSQHDVYLKHYRRYSLGQLRKMVQGAGLVPVRQGYLFGSLLPIRLASALVQKVLPPKTNQAQGIGQWKHGTALTRLIQAALYFDNRWLLFLSRLGIHLPGLTSWVLCQKSERT